MRIFPITQQGARKLQQGFVQRIGLLASLFVGFTLGTLFGMNWGKPSIELTIIKAFLLLTSLFFLALFVFGIRGQVKKQRPLWESTEFELGDTYIALRQASNLLIQIRFDEITHLVTTPTGLNVRTARRYHNLHIPTDTQGYEELRSLLSVWNRLQERPRAESILLSVFLGGMGLIFLWTFFSRIPALGVACTLFTIGAYALIYFTSSI